MHHCKPTRSCYGHFAGSRLSFPGTQGKTIQRGTTPGHLVMGVWKCTAATTVSIKKKLHTDSHCLKTDDPRHPSSHFPLLPRFLPSPILPCLPLPVTSSPMVSRIFCLAESRVWLSAFKEQKGVWLFSALICLFIYCVEIEYTDAFLKGDFNEQLVFLVLYFWLINKFAILISSGCSDSSEYIRIF